MKTIEQFPTDLVLGIRTGDLIPTTGLTVLKEETVDFGDFQLVFRIIGESHWVLVLCKEQLVFQEVFACINLKGDWVHRHAFYDGKEHSFQTDGYSIEVVFLTFHQHQQEEECSRSDGSIQVNFPHPHGGPDKPFTRVEWELTKEGWVNWNTIHVYPTPSGEETRVFTQSTFRTGEDNQCFGQPQD